MVACAGEYCGWMDGWMMEQGRPIKGEYIDHEASQKVPEVYIDDVG
jgi:hypothetical protein